MSVSAGIISMGAYMPAGGIRLSKKADLAAYLRDKTLLPREYIEQIEAQARLPGTIETNEEGWARQPWFEAWLANLPPQTSGGPISGRQGETKSAS